MGVVNLYALNKDLYTHYPLWILGDHMVKKHKTTCCSDMANSCSGGMTYGLGFIGALVYFVSTSTGFWMTVLAILKAVIWPVFVVYGLLRLAGM